MEKYKIVICEQISQTFEVSAESEEDALETAISKYKNGDIVVDNGSGLVSSEIAINDSEFINID